MSRFDLHQGDKPRMVFLLLVTLAASLLLIIGLAWLQLIAPHKFEAIEKRQIERRILNPGPRGDIYDRNGKLLVGNRPHYTAAVYLDDLRPEFRKEYSVIIRAERQRIKAVYLATALKNRGESPPSPDYGKLEWQARTNVIQRYLDQINQITGQNNRLSDKKIKRHYREKLMLPLALVQDLSSDHYARLVEQIPVQSPIQIHTSTARYYPFGTAAAHTLGYVQEVDPDRNEIPDDGIKTFTSKTKRGKSGLEYFFDASLRGSTGTEIWRVDPLGFQDTRLEMIPPQQGQNLITSLDIELQMAAEIALGARTGAAVALDIQSGEVLAMVSHPSYNLNDVSPYFPQSVVDDLNENKGWTNRSLQQCYPPGSTFKLITSIAGLRSGAIQIDSRVDCQGIHRIGNRNFRCHARYGHGDTDLAKAIEGSCNVFYYSEGLKIGIDSIAAEAKRFGLDQKTGIQDPNESNNMVVPSKEWKRAKIQAGWVPGDTANTAIGQGYLSVTPLQMATVIASIARNQTRTSPTLLALTHAQAQQVEHGGESIGLTPAQKELLWQGMERVVSPSGTAGHAQIDNFRIAGKTGTADFRTYGKDFNLAWFVGFAPVENPQIAVAIMVEGTKESDSYHGGSTAGPVAKDIFLKFIEKYPERAGR
jgi:penicillin-binding protein 2